MKKKFAAWLQKQLADRDMTQADLCRASSITDAQISRLINGTRGIGAKALGAIAEALQLPPDVVYREAGLLPIEPKKITIVKTLELVMSSLPLKEQEEVLEYARWRRKRSNQKTKAPSG